jgi:hypothetical protein
MDFLPEWKIYLWKKLILNKDGEYDRPIKVRNFCFFSDVEQRELTRNKVQKTIDSINVAVASRTLITPGSRDTTSEDSFFYFDSIKTFHALVDLTKKPGAIELSDIHLNKTYFRDCKPENKYCSLGEVVYKKIQADQGITLKEIGLHIYPDQYKDSRLIDSFIFRIKIDKEKLEEKLNTYLSDFMESKLLGPKGVRYFDPKKQSRDILAVIKKLSAKYGSNMVLTADEVAKAGGWYLKDEHHYRFYETLFALEKSGDIKITDLRKDEIILTFSEKVVPQVVPAVTPKKTVVEEIKSITFISENKKADKVSSFYINQHIHDVHKMQRLSSEVRKLARVADGEEVPFEKQTHDYINTNKNCVLYCKGKYRLTKIIDGHSKPLKISRGIEVEVIDDKIFKRRVAQSEKVSA